jgi:hypothetical protein
MAARGGGAAWSGGAESGPALAKLPLETVGGVKSAALGRGACEAAEDPGVSRRGGVTATASPTRRSEPTARMGPPT